MCCIRNRDLSVLPIYTAMYCAKDTSFLLCKIFMVIVQSKTTITQSSLNNGNFPRSVCSLELNSLYFDTLILFMFYVWQYARCFMGVEFIHCL